MMNTINIIKKVGEVMDKDTEKTLSIQLTINKFNYNVEKILYYEMYNANLLKIKNFKIRAFKDNIEKIDSHIDSIEKQIIEFKKSGGNKSILLKVLAKYKYKAGMYNNKKSELNKIGTNMLLKGVNFVLLMIITSILTMSNISLEHDSLFLAANKIFTFIYDNWKNYLFILFVFLMYIVVAIRIATPGKQEEVVNNVIKYIEDIIELEYCSNYK